MQIPSWINYLAAYLTIASGIYAAFNASEGLLRSETKQRIGAWLGRPDRSKQIFDKEWTASFIEFFDTLFVPEHRRGWSYPLPGFCRSAVISILFIVILTFTLSLLSENIYNDLNSLEEVLLTILLGCAVNSFLDYLSIIETRLVLERMKISKRPYFWIIFDAFITFILPYTSLYIVASYFSSDNVAIPIFLDYLEFIFIIENEHNPFAIFIYSTFLTSIWIWLYTIANALMHFGKHIESFQRLLDRHTLLEEKPLSVMGWLLIGTMTVLFSGYVGFAQLMA